MAWSVMPPPMVLVWTWGGDEDGQPLAPARARPNRHLAWSRARGVTWQLLDRRLHLYDEQQTSLRQSGYAGHELQLGERLLDDRWPVGLADGSSLWITQGASDLQARLRPAHGVALRSSCCG